MAGLLFTTIQSTGHSICRAMAKDTLFQKLKINNQATRQLAIIVTQ
jgi:hypothetical protein